MDSAVDYWAAADLLKWQVEMGADEAILDAPLDRYALEPLAPAAEKPARVDAPAAKDKKGTPPPILDVLKVDPAAIAARRAASAKSLEELAATMEAFEHCDLRHGARNFIFAEGMPSARVMILGDAPKRDDDVKGQLFVGPVGVLFDRMFEAIGLRRDSELSAEALYVTTLLPWRTPSDRTPSADEVEMMLPFVKKHISLVAPDVLVLFGGVTCQTFLGQGGMARKRGRWAEIEGRPALPMFHPMQVMGDPDKKRDTWADLLSLKSKLRELQ